MSPVFDQYLQQNSQTEVSQSRHSRSATADQLSWPRGSKRGQEGGGGRRRDWGGMTAGAASEPDFMSRQLHIDVNLPVSAFASPDCQSCVFVLMHGTITGPPDCL